MMIYTKHDYAMKYLEDNFDLKLFDVKKMDSNKKGFLITDSQNNRLFVYYVKQGVVRVVGSGMDKEQYVSMYTKTAELWSPPKIQ